MKKTIISLILVSVVCAVVLAGVTFQPQQGRDGENALPVVPMAPPIQGTPQMNVTDVWIVIIGEVDREYPIDYYQATLLHEGKTLVGPVTIKPMLLGQNGSISFWFFENNPGETCEYSTDPCDGMLSQGDYLELSDIVPGETYVVQVLWKATGEVLAEVEVNT